MSSLRVSVSFPQLPSQTNQWKYWFFPFVFTQHSSIRLFICCENAPIRRCIGTVAACTPSLKTGHTFCRYLRLIRTANRKSGSSTINKSHSELKSDWLFCFIVGCDWLKEEKNGLCFPAASSNASKSRWDLRGNIIQTCWHFDLWFAVHFRRWCLYVG